MGQQWFRSIRPVAAAGGVAVALAGLVACGRADPGPSMDVIAVTTQTARLTTLRDSVMAAGTVTTQAAAEFVAVAPVSAEIVEMPKQEGEAVQVGDVVVRLDIPSITTELATRQIELAEAGMRVDRAKAEVARLKGLVDSGLAPRNMLESAQLAQSVADGTLTTAKALFDSAKAEEAKTLIRAPFPGIVVKRWHAPGDLVAGSEADPILRIVDPTRLQVSVMIPLVESARVQPGQAATIHTTAGGEAATVIFKVPPPTPADMTAEVRLSFVAPTTLPIDSMVQADIIIGERASVIVVPADAVQRADGRTFVWVPNDNGQAVRRDVQVGLVINHLAEITSGLAFGDLLIVTALAQLTEGAPIATGGG